jgi:hypothetical protein
MAIYYTKTTLTEPVLLTEDLRTILEARGGELYLEKEEETVLDGIVAERMPLGAYSVVFEDGMTGVWYTSDEEAVRDLRADHESVSDDLVRFAMMEEEDLLHEILKINPDIDHLTLQSAHSCSRMRLDGFGGTGVIVNRKGYLIINSASFRIDDDGVISPAATFRPWSDEKTAAS